MKFNKNDLQESKAFKILQKYWLYIVVATAMIVVAISSISIYREEVLEIDPDVNYVQQDTLYFAATSIDTLNPVVSSSEDTFYISKLIYNSLFDYTDDLNVQPELAESYEVNTDRAYVDITLKDGVLWHDGTELTAGDVRFTVNAIKSYGSEGIYYEAVSKINSVIVQGDKTLRIYFRNNTDCSLDALTFPILPEDQYSSTRSLINTTDDFEPVGTGQYKFASYDYLEALNLSPNEQYFGTKAANSITVNILPDKSLASNMMEINNVTCYIDDTTERKSLVADKGFQMYDIVSNDVDFIVFNTSAEILSTKEMRQALCYAIDRDEVLNDGYMGDGVITDTIYYPNFLGVSDTGDVYSYDRDKAIELMAEQGYEDSDLNGKLENGDGEEVSLNILVNSDNANRLAAARIIEDNLESAGFSVTITSADWEEYTDLIERGEFDILVTGYEIEASYDLRGFFDGTNPWNYTNNDILQLVNELDRLHTSQEYTAAYEKIKEALIDEIPYYSLCYRKMGLVGLSTFEADQLPMFNDIYRNCNTWSWSIQEG